MPKLLVFAPCEKVIVAQEDNTTSVISLLQGFTLPPIQSENVVMIPVTWYMFSLWEKQDGDTVELRQRFELIGPNKTVLLGGEAPVIISLEADKRFHRTASRLLGFPIRGDGDYTLRLLLGRVGGEFSEVASFPIPVDFNNTSATPLQTQPIGTAIP